MYSIVMWLMLFFLIVDISPKQTLKHWSNLTWIFSIYIKGLAQVVINYEVLWNKYKKAL